MSSILNSQSLQAKQDLARREIIDFSRASWERLQAIQREGMNLFWNRPDGLTPQEVAEALGTTALPIFQFHGVLTNAVVTISQNDGTPPNILLPSNAFTVNPDGSVTVTDQPYVP